MSEEITLFSVDIDTDKVDKNLLNVNQKLEILKQESRENRKEFANFQKTAGRTGISLQEYTKRMTANENETKRLKGTKRQLQKELNATSNSYNALSSTTAKLRARQKDLDTSTEQGRKEYQKLATQIKTNNERLKEQDAQVGVTGRNVGNYSSALDGAEGALSQVNPAVGGFISGLKSATAAGKAFIATPLGAVIAALAVALGALAAFFTKTQAGQDALLKTTNRLSAIFDVIVEQVILVGKSLFEAFENPKQAVTDLFDFLKSQVTNRITAIQDIFVQFGKVVGKALKGDFEGAEEAAKELNTAVIQLGTGLDGVQQEATKQYFTDLGGEINGAVRGADRLTNAMIGLETAEVSFARTQAERSKAIAENILLTRDETASFQERAQALEAAGELEKDNLKEQIALQRQRLEVAKANLEELPVNQRLKNRELQKAVQDAQAELLKLETNSLNRTREIQNRKTELRNKELGEIRKQRAAEVKLLQFSLELEAEQADTQEERLLKRIEVIEKVRDFELTNTELLASERELIEKKAAENIRKIKEDAALAEIEEARERQERQINLQRELAAQELAIEIKNNENKFAAQRELFDIQQEAAILEAEKEAENKIEFELQKQLIENDFRQRRRELDEEEIEFKKQKAAQEIDIERQKEEAILSLTVGAIGATRALLETFGLQSKDLAIAQTTIETFMAAQKAYNSQLTIPTPDAPARAAVAASIAVAQGLARVAQISSTPAFEKGGIVDKFNRGGVLRGPSHEQGGIPIASRGRVVAEAEGGEPILTKNVSRSPKLLARASAINIEAGGRPLMASGGTVPSQVNQSADRIAQRNQTSRELREFIENMPSPVVSVEEFNKVNRKVRVLESKSRL